MIIFVLDNLLCVVWRCVFQISSLYFIAIPLSNINTIALVIRSRIVILIIMHHSTSTITFLHQ